MEEENFNPETNPDAIEAALGDEIFIEEEEEEYSFIFRKNRNNEEENDDNDDLDISFIDDDPRDWF